MSRRHGGAGLAPRTACALLLVLAALHASLGVYLGVTDGGDFSMVVVAAPLMVLTALAGLLVLGRTRLLSGVPVVLTSVAVALSLLMVGVYGVGLFHLPQSVLALAVVLLRAPR